MADLVQSALDQMVAPLRDLLDRGIFSETEIRAIVNRRRESEYLLRRLNSRKADYLRYIEAEMNLEKLRALRSKKLADRKHRKALTPEEQQKHNKKKDSKIGDGHIIQHVHTLFVRALRKFRGDVSLHLQHAAFAKEAKSFNRLDKIYTQALQVHPRNVGLWIEAASHEFFGVTVDGKPMRGGSIQTARVLMQRGLRLNATAQELWVQYFALEMHQIQKLRGRREILRILQDDGDGDGKADAAIPMVVFRNAIKAIPDNVSFRMKFLDLCQLFPETEKLETQITESIERDFNTKPEAWIARASYIASKSDTQEEDDSQAVGFAVAPTGGDQDPNDDTPTPAKRRKVVEHQWKDKVLALLAEGISVVPTTEMYTQTIRFAKHYGAEKTTSETSRFLSSLFQGAKDLQLLSSDIVLEMAESYQANGDLVKAIREVKSFVAQVDDADVTVWLQLAQLLRQGDNTAEAVKVLRSALDGIPLHDKSYVVVLLELFGATLALEQAKHEVVHDTFQRILLLSPGRSVRFNSTFGVGSVSQACLALLTNKVDAGEKDEAIRVVDSVLRSDFCVSKNRRDGEEAHTMRDFFVLALDLLKAEPKSKSRKFQLRRIYQCAIEFFEDIAPDVADYFRDRKSEDLRFT